MCNCSNTTCPYCDPGIEAFFQEKVKEAKEAAEAHFKATGIKFHYEDLLDAKNIWYEYCSLGKNSRMMDDVLPPFDGEADAYDHIGEYEWFLQHQSYSDYHNTGDILIVDPKVEEADEYWEQLMLNEYIDDVGKAMEIDAAIELKAMCENAANEEAVLKAERNNK